MVNAILEDRKTQTRRAVKPQPEWLPEVASARVNGPFAWPIGALGQQCGQPLTRLPYGVPGDRLYVRETFRLPRHVDTYRPAALPRVPIWYVADGEPSADTWGKTRVSIHMPRWASRLLLEVTDVHVERLHSITEGDAKAEGASFHDGRGIGHSGWRHDRKDVHATARGSFFRLWSEINGMESFTANPFVWVVSFKRLG